MRNEQTRLLAPGGQNPKHMGLSQPYIWGIHILDTEYTININNIHNQYSINVTIKRVTTF